MDDISFTVEDGVIYGLLGPNGAGKSTIMNILTGYLAATEGQVTVAGHPLPEEADAAKACVGYLPEQPPLYPEMTVAEYLDFAAELKGVKKADRPAQVQSAARRTGLEDVLPRLIRSLSKGYRQRVGEMCIRDRCWYCRPGSADTADRRPGRKGRGVPLTGRCPSSKRPRSGRCRCTRGRRSGARSDVRRRQPQR